MKGIERAARWQLPQNYEFMGYEGSFTLRHFSSGNLENSRHLIFAVRSVRTK
jgi:hypothetical protein